MLGPVCIIFFKTNHGGKKATCHSKFVPFNEVSPLHHQYIFYKTLLFLERGREGERKGEREGEKHHWAAASQVPLPGTWPTTQACALTGN